MDNKIITILTLLHLKKIGRKTAFSIINKNYSLLNQNGSPTNIAKELLLSNNYFDYSTIDISNAYDTALEKIEKTKAYERIKVITYWDTDYPNRLKQIDDPPLLLNYIGDISQLNQTKSVALIGTRNINSHINKIATNLGKLLAENFIITGGLAKGCDTAGHKGCLQSGGITVAVCGKPLDVIYPKENRKLAEEIIAKKGVLISEYFVGEKSYLQPFIERNRIQAGLSEAIIVVASGVNGGTMRTVKFGKKHKRLICCYKPDIKHRNDENFQGNIKLIRDGAIPITNTQSIVALTKQIIQ